MITSREHYTITTPTDLSSKPSVVLATKAHYEPNYMSMPSEGTILTCEQLFDALSKRNTYTSCKLVRLSDYDFQGMHETDLTTQYTRLGWLVEEQEVPVYDPDMDIFSNRPYSTLLKTSTVVYFKGRKHFFCVEFGLPLLEGSCRATAEFLFYVLNENEAITVVNE